MEGLPPEKELTHHDLCLVMKTSGVSFSDHKNQLKVLHHLCQTYRQIAQPDGDFEPKDGNLQYGACILHFGIRSVEALFQMGYRQDIKVSRERLSPEDREAIGYREQEVKYQFRDKLGLIIDERRDGGAGNTTTGNVARKVFEHPGEKPSSFNFFIPNPMLISALLA